MGTVVSSTDLTSIVFWDLDKKTAEIGNDKLRCFANGPVLEYSHFFKNYYLKIIYLLP